MEQPSGFHYPSHLDYVCTIHKSIYDLKQSPQAWFHKLNFHLTKLIFILSSQDHFSYLC